MKASDDKYLLGTAFLRKFLAQGSGSDELDQLMRDELKRREEFHDAEFGGPELRAAEAFEKEA
jgi:hypothetical protein